MEQVEARGWWPRNQWRVAVAVTVLLAAVWFGSWREDRRQDRAEKEVCETVHGAGMCVETGGEWVRVGTRG